MRAVQKQRANRTWNCARKSSARSALLAATGTEVFSSCTASLQQRKRHSSAASACSRLPNAAAHTCSWAHCTTANSMLNQGAHSTFKLSSTSTRLDGVAFAARASTRP